MVETGKIKKLCHEEGILHYIDVETCCFLSILKKKSSWKLTGERHSLYIYSYTHARLAIKPKEEGGVHINVRLVMTQSMR